MFDWVVAVVGNLGYAGVAALTFLENLFPPIPSEVVIPLAGFVAARGDLRLDLVILTGALGSLAGAIAWYEAARRIGERRLRAWIERRGRWLTLTTADIERSRGWFHRHGGAAVFFGRLVPGVRTLVSVPAGFSEMPRGRFLAYSALGTLAWTGVLAYAGVVLEANFRLVADYVDLAADVLLGALALLLVWRYVRCWRERRA